MTNPRTLRSFARACATRSSHRRPRSCVIIFQEPRTYAYRHLRTFPSTRSRASWAREKVSKLYLICIHTRLTKKIPSSFSRRRFTSLCCDSPSRHGPIGKENETGIPLVSPCGAGSTASLAIGHFGSTSFLTLASEEKEAEYYCVRVEGERESFVSYLRQRRVLSVSWR